MEAFEGPKVKKIKMYISFNMIKSAEFKFAD